VLLEEQAPDWLAVASATRAGFAVSYTVSYAVVVTVFCVQTDSATARPAMGRREKKVDFMVFDVCLMDG
jgi:hypothetical protein